LALFRWVVAPSECHQWQHVVLISCSSIAQVFAKHSDVPEAKGLFNPENDKDACGVGFVADLSKEHSRKTVSDALEMLVRMKHRGACGCEANTGTAVVSRGMLVNRSCKKGICADWNSRPALQVMALASWLPFPTCSFLTSRRRSAAFSCHPE
jgi:hypothetical protein